MDILPVLCLCTTMHAVPEEGVTPSGRFVKCHVGAENHTMSPASSVFLTAKSRLQPNPNTYFFLFYNHSCVLVSVRVRSCYGTSVEARCAGALVGVSSLTSTTWVRASNSGRQLPASAFTRWAISPAQDHYLDKAKRWVQHGIASLFLSTR